MILLPNLQRGPSLTALRSISRKIFSSSLRLQCVIGAVGVSFIILTIFYSLKSDLPIFSAKDHFHSPSQDVQNKTLGFGKVYYMSLPFRTDRQDSMELLAATTNISLTYQPAIMGNTMHAKAKPSDGGFLRDEQWGCWRSHADLWKRVIKEDLDTALILEDDADWDVNVHDIFQELSTHLRGGRLRSERMSEKEATTAPYGLDWDILYVGTCWDIPREPRPKHLTYNDPNGPVRANLTGTFISELENWGARVTDTTRKRVIARSWYPICTIGYAVTQIGARRLLYNVGGVKPIGSAVDLAMNGQVQGGFLKGYTVVPPLVTPWKTGSILDSDIDDMQEKEKELKEGEKLEVGSRNLWRSARMSMNVTLGNAQDF